MHPVSRTPLFRLRRNVPSHHGQADESRTVVEILRLRLAWSVYKEPVRAPSGAPIGIRKSFWIFTDRWAYGRGEVTDWARLERLEVKIAGVQPIVTESGTFDLYPALQIPRGSEIEIRLYNRNPVDCTGILRLFDVNQAPVLIEAISFAVLARAQKLLATAAARYPRTAHRVIYETWSEGNYRSGRIFGRPEWL